MKTATTFAALIVGLLTVIPADAARTTRRASDPDEVVRDLTLRQQAWQLFSSVQRGRSSLERAAFIVRDTDGHQALSVWPADAEPLRATFHGVVPSGTIAIIHTHPNNFPFPSLNDQEIARQIGIPVYTLTRRRISKTDGFTVESVWCGNWNPRSSREGSRCTPDSPRGAVSHQAGRP